MYSKNDDYNSIRFNGSFSLSDDDPSDSTDLKWIRIIFGSGTEVAEEVLKEEVFFGS